MKSYQRFSSLQNHLDLGRHERSLENHTMLDKAALGYAARVQQQSTGVPQLRQNVATLGARASQTTLQKGWALRGSQTGRTRFSEKQRTYMIDKFMIGETTGRKVNAAEVARSMMTARDVNGQRMFSSADFLTTQQITSFFSRLASKRRLASADKEINAESEDEDDSAQIEMDLEEMRATIMASTLPTHPICYENHNLCDLLTKGRLKNFAIDMLKNMT